MTRILVVHGPNLGSLGNREPHIYGRTTLPEINARLAAVAKDRGVSLEVYQSNHEGAILDKLEESSGSIDGLVINPGGLTHTSVVLRDAVAGLGIPAVEVHLTNIHSREPFRRQSLLSDVVLGQVVGLGSYGYILALLGLLDRSEAVGSHEGGQR
jgi:3-dehydroquinate dehydratase-2